MLAFKNLNTQDDLKAYLLNVLSRTGGKRKNEVFLYHYSRIPKFYSILLGGYLWLGSAENMNDYLESQFIGSGKNKDRLFFSCFSKAEENLAMYKMYAPRPNGAMMSLSFSSAQLLIDSLPKSGDKKLVRIVRDNKLTDDTVEADVYWSAVVYKDLHSNLLKADTVFNRKINWPLSIPELAGYVKLNGWEYEKEVRLCAVTTSKLGENEKIAIRLPEEVIKNVRIVKCPGFEISTCRNYIVQLKSRGVSVRESEYEGLVDLQEKEKNLIINKETIEDDYSVKHKMGSSSALSWINDLFKRCLELSSVAESVLSPDNPEKRIENYSKYCAMRNDLVDVFLVEKAIYEEVIEEAGFPDLGDRLDKYVSGNDNMIDLYLHKSDTTASTEMNNTLVAEIQDTFRNLQKVLARM